MPVRLDKFLKVSRIIKRRSVAQQACDAGMVLLNGKQAKPSATVKVGDVIEVSIGQRTTRHEVLALSTTATKEAASEMSRPLS
jgi:ribosomal 50S subunit-recycling heat shock protein